jgi:TPR repeat protein
MDTKSGSYNPAQGVYWLRKAAESNGAGETADAQALYARMLVNGFNEGGMTVSRDLDQAHYWAKKAQAGGSQEASKIISEIERSRAGAERKP